LDIAAVRGAQQRAVGCDNRVGNVTTLNGELPHIGEVKWRLGLDRRTEEGVHLRNGRNRRVDDLRHVVVVIRIVGDLDPIDVGQD